MKRYAQKWISVSLANKIKSYQRYLQIQENIRKGKKANRVTFQDASSDIKGLIKYMEKD